MTFEEVSKSMNTAVSLLSPAKLPLYLSSDTIIPLYSYFRFNSGLLKYSIIGILYQSMYL